ncbi:hypothetical protein BC567DRAFT_236214 [Phyllosticta citribraziliensis]
MAYVHCKLMILQPLSFSCLLSCLSLLTSPSLHHHPASTATAIPVPRGRSYPSVRQPNCCTPHAQTNGRSFVRSFGTAGRPDGRDAATNRARRQRVSLLSGLANSEEW